MGNICKFFSRNNNRILPTKPAPIRRQSTLSFYSQSNSNSESPDWTPLTPEQKQQQLPKIQKIFGIKSIELTSKSTIKQQ